MALRHPVSPIENSGGLMDGTDRIDSELEATSYIIQKKYVGVFIKPRRVDDEMLTLLLQRIEDGKQAALREIELPKRLE